MEPMDRNLPYYLGAIGPGFLNQVPTLVVLVETRSILLDMMCRYRPREPNTPELRNVP